MDFRSVTAGGSHRADVLSKTAFAEALEAYPQKFLWFVQRGYRPHVWQTLFHSASTDGKLTDNRHLVAGRRGGKTLSAAWEVLFYALHPRVFHMDAHGVESDRPLWIWALAKDYKLGRPSLLTFIQVIRDAGLVKGKDYEYNKTEKVFEFFGPDGTPTAMVEFKSADDPQNLRGAGLDILWIDESAFIPNDDAWTVVSPALADKEGLVITTTTPHGKNWFWSTFFDGGVLEDPDHFRVQYTSIDNPYFSRKSWDKYLRDYHPIMFKQEFMAAFDALVGIALQGEWLKFWVRGNADIQSDDISLKHLLTEDGQRYRMRVFIGVDPAISLSDKADHFAMAAIGLSEDGTQVFLLDYYVDRIEFPDQLDKIKEWHLKWRPDYIGIESNAFQRALLQMTARMGGLPNLVAVMSKSQKQERLLGLGPLAKTGTLRINKRHVEFIDQWVSFNPDPKIKNQDDDLLDAVEIAIGLTGALLPGLPSVENFDTPPRSLEEEAARQVRQRRYEEGYIPELGIDA